jgi:hypothetical protein
MASLITLFSKVGVAVPEEGLPSNAVAPKDWAVFTLWFWEPMDEGKEFDQLVQVLGPDDILFAEVKSKFVMEKEKNSRFQVKMPLVGLPVGQQGNCTVRLSLMHDGRIVAEPTPILIQIEHQPTKPGTS